jgi:hypothetical protein
MFPFLMKKSISGHRHVKLHKEIHYIHSHTLYKNNVYKECTCNYVNKCRIAESLKLKQYVRYSREFNAHTI